MGRVILNERTIFRHGYFLGCGLCTYSFGYTTGDQRSDMFD